MSQSGRYTPSIVPGTYVETLTGNSGGAVGPTTSGNINVIGDGVVTTTIGNPGTNTLEITLTGAVADEYETDIGTATPSGGAIKFTATGTGLLFEGSGNTVSLDGILGILNGGTGSSGFTPYSVIVAGTTGTGNLENVSGVGTSGQVLTSNGPSAYPTWQSAGSGGITTIDGNSGSVTGSTVTITDTEGTALFTGSGTTLTHTYSTTDGLYNTILGAASASGSITGGFNVGFGPAIMDASSITGSQNSALGYGALGGTGPISGSFNQAIGGSSLSALTSGASNCALGHGAGAGITSGSENIFIGEGAGDNYTGAESSNILLNNNGTLGESHTLRIGQGTGTSTGYLNAAYIQGIAGTTVSNKNYVTINTTTGQMGSDSGPSGGITTIDGNTGSVTGSTVTIEESEASSAQFSGSGTVLSLTLTSTDGNGNTILGSRSNFISVTGVTNTSLGDYSFHSLTSGSENVAIGQSALPSLTTGVKNTAIGQQAAGGTLNTGSYNTIIGYNAGAAYTGAESSNIVIGSSNSGSGSAGESNALRIGGGGTGSGNYQLNKVFICGINGITVSSADQLLLINSSDQLASLAHGTSGTVLTSAGAGANPTWTALPTTTFDKIVVQTFTSSGTYTPTSGMQYCTIEVVGGGGGGGGAPTTSAGQLGGGSGGGGAGYARKTVTSSTIGASQTVTVGTGGSAGSSSGGNGGTGNTSSVGSIVTATGGSGGIGSVAGSSFGAGGGAGGAGSSGDVNASGNSGSYSYGTTILNTSFGGSGGNSIFGGGGKSAIAGGSVAGTAGINYGGGGGGAACTPSSAGVAGGAGAPGIVIITEYCH